MNWESELYQWDVYREHGYDEPHTGWVYFIRQRRKGPIKVGFTREFAGVWRRLASLQTGNPYRLSVVAFVPGSRRTETMLHQWCMSRRLEGEWFRGDTRVLNALIDRYAVNALKDEAKEAA